MFYIRPNIGTYWYYFNFFLKQKLTILQGQIQEGQGSTPYLSQKNTVQNRQSSLVYNIPTSMPQKNG